MNFSESASAAERRGLGTRRKRSEELFVLTALFYFNY
jgi:hypothetical protein